MNNVNFDLKSINTYLSERVMDFGANDASLVNSIFSKCDVEDEQGNQKPDGKLTTNNEINTFFDMIKQQLPKVLLALQSFKDLVTGNTQTQQIQNVNPQATQNSSSIQNDPFMEVENKLSTDDQKKYAENLQKAKDVIRDNNGTLKLSDEEITFILNASLKAENNNGAARKASATDLIFNYNNEGGVPDVGSIVKIMIHEATHMSLNSTKNTKNEERKCETRAINCALDLIKEGKIEHFTILGSSTGDITTENFINNKDALTKFIDEWINNGYSHLPEN